MNLSDGMPPSDQREEERMYAELVEEGETFYRKHGERENGE